MKQKGKDGSTKYERHFAKIKKHNEQYEQKLFLASYKSPVPTSDNDLQSEKQGQQHSQEKQEKL